MIVRLPLTHVETDGLEVEPLTPSVPELAGSGLLSPGRTVEMPPSSDEGLSTDSSDWRMSGVRAWSTASV